MNKISILEIMVFANITPKTLISHKLKGYLLDHHIIYT